MVFIWIKMLTFFSLPGRAVFIVLTCHPNAVLVWKSKSKAEIQMEVVCWKCLFGNNHQLWRWGFSFPSIPVSGFVPLEWPHIPGSYSSGLANRGFSAGLLWNSDPFLLLVLDEIWNCFLKQTLSLFIQKWYSDILISNAVTVRTVPVLVLVQPVMPAEPGAMQMGWNRWICLFKIQQQGAFQKSNARGT